MRRGKQPLDLFAGRDQRVDLGSSARRTGVISKHRVARQSLDLDRVAAIGAACSSSANAAIRSDGTGMAGLMLASIAAGGEQLVVPRCDPLSVLLVERQAGRDGVEDAQQLAPADGEETAACDDLGNHRPGAAGPGAFCGGGDRQVRWIGRGQCLVEGSRGGKRGSRA